MERLGLAFSLTAIHNCFNTSILPPLLFLISKFMVAKHQKFLNSPEAFKHTSETPLFRLVDQFPRLAWNSFAKRQAATCCFQKRLVKIREGCPPMEERKENSKENSSLQCRFWKVLVNLKAFGAERLGTYKFNIILK
jgi:hypothetical protein